MPVIDVTNVSQTFGQGTSAVTVLKHVSFTADTGSLTLIVGPSGAGKSTLLTIIGGLLTPTSGQVTLAGVDLNNANKQAREQLRLNQIGFVLQQYHLLPFLTVADQFALVERVKRHGNLSQAALQTLLKELDIADLTKKYPNELSGGQQQRVAIARALYPDPAIVLADEPTAALDSARVQAVGTLLASLAHERGKTVVAVTHDARLAHFADATFGILDGHLTQQGDPTVIGA